MTSLERAFEHLDQFARLRIREANMPGMAVAVTDREKLLRVSTYGFADMAAQAAITPGSIFEIGSIGKSFTNIALLQLRDEGRLDLHAPVTQYLPWFQVRSEFQPIAIHHVMSHTSGIITGTEVAPHGYFESWALRETQTGASPGEYFHYSNIGYKTLGFLLEELTGQPYQTVIQSRVLDPLGMNATHPVITFETRRHAAVGYRSFYDDRPEHPSHGLVPALWGEYGAGDGCQASTAADMATYLRTLMNRGLGPRGRLISAESFDLMAQHVIGIPLWGGAYYGYGLTVGEIDGHTYLGHGGGTPGYMSAIVGDMDDGLGVVVLVNGFGDFYGITEVAMHMLAVLRAGFHGLAMPSEPSKPDPSFIDNAADYANTYKAGNRSISLTSQDGRVLLKYNGQVVGLEERGEDRFYVGHPDLDLFLMEFKREGGKVVEAFHGPHWYVNDCYAGPMDFDYPKEWDAYSGHYRAHNPGLSNFRVVLRKGALVLIPPSGSAEKLVPLSDDAFRIGEDRRSPETLRFDVPVGGRTLRADYSGCPYYRTFTP